jgi:hypothetical protein
MKILKVAVSNEAPNLKDCMWAKPFNDGFALYLLDGSIWKPLKLVSPKNLFTLADDAVINSDALYDAVGNYENVGDIVHTKGEKTKA